MQILSAAFSEYYLLNQPCVKKIKEELSIIIVLIITNMAHKLDIYVFISTKLNLYRSPGYSCKLNVQQRLRNSYLPTEILWNSMLNTNTYQT